MHDKMVWIPFASLSMACLAGAMLPFQATANASLGRALGHPFWGAAVSLTFSLLLAGALLVLVKAPTPDFANAWRGPWWSWVGGAIGALYVLCATLLLPRLGAANFLVAVVAGQMVMALVADHLGLMGLQIQPLNWPRVLGVLCLLCGVVLIQYVKTPRDEAVLAAAHTMQVDRPGR